MNEGDWTERYELPREEAVARDREQATVLHDVRPDFISVEPEGAFFEQSRFEVIPGNVPARGGPHRPSDDDLPVTSFEEFTREAWDAATERDLELDDLELGGDTGAVK